MNTVLWNALLKSSDRVLEEIKLNGYVLPGNNGPYHDPETPVRNSAHWIIIFSFLYKQTEEKRYLCAIRALANYLKGSSEENGTFLCRKKDGKDSVNGIIGMAWVIEGLIKAAEIIHDEECYEVAKRAFFAQKFNYRNGLWDIIETDGRSLGYDVTYNHQLWLAASGAQISMYHRDITIDKYVNCFLDKSRKTFQIYNDGLIFHFVYKNGRMLSEIKALRRYLKQCAMRKRKLPSLEYKESGYHYFAMYGFAILHRAYPTHVFWASKKFVKALNYSLNFDNAWKLKDNPFEKDQTNLANTITSRCNVYGFSYNSPAFELPLIIKEFSKNGHEKELSELMRLQFELTYNIANSCFEQNTEDPRTLESRMYEYVRAFE